MTMNLLPITTSNYSNLDASGNPRTTCLAQHRPDTQSRTYLWNVSDIMVRYNPLSSPAANLPYAPEQPTTQLRNRPPSPCHCHEDLCLPASHPSLWEKENSAVEEHRFPMYRPTKYYRRI